MGYGCNTGNGATLNANFKKKEEQIFVSTSEKRKVKKLKEFSKITRLDKPELSLQSQQADPRQWK